jgi:hypothetical protein
MTEKNRTEISQENNSISAQLKIGDNDTQSSKSQLNKSISISKITHTGNMLSSGNTLAQSPSKVLADFNGDGFGDKAIGVAGEDIGIARDAGARQRHLWLSQWLVGYRFNTRPLLDSKLNRY